MCGETSCCHTRSCARLQAPVASRLPASSACASQEEGLCAWEAVLMGGYVEVLMCVTKYLHGRAGSACQAAWSASCLLLCVVSVYV